MEHLNETLLLTNSAKHDRWVSYTFVQKPRSFKCFSILEENCDADIINRTFKCKIFVNKCSKTSPWVSYTFLQKPCSFKRFNILEENCVANINNGRFKCKTFVDKCCKKFSLSNLYFPTKTTSCEALQHFIRNLWCRKFKNVRLLLTNAGKNGCWVIYI